MIAFLDALKTKKVPLLSQAAQKSVTLLEAASRAQFAQAHHRHYQSALEQISHVQIELSEVGLSLSTPAGYRWLPDDPNAQEFADLPVAFGQAYLQMRLRGFLSEVFCQSGIFRKEQAIETASLSQTDLEDSLSLAANDRIGGGLHVGVLQQFAQSNRGEGYFHPGWQVLREEEDGAIALQNYGVTLHIERERYLRPEARNAQPGDTVAIWMPGHRFESEAYIAIGNCGPVLEDSPALDIALAVPVAAVGTVMTQLTTCLNESVRTPFTLKAPYKPEGYEGPEAMVLRIEIADYANVLPALQQVGKQISQHCQAMTPPLFACPLLPGVSFACRATSTHGRNRPERWYGSSVNLSRLDAIASALTKAWYAKRGIHPQTDPLPDQLPLATHSPTPAENLTAIQFEFTQMGLDWKKPYWTAEVR